MQHFPHTVSAKRKRKNAFKRPSFGAFLVTWITQNIGFNPILRKSETVCKKNINPIL